MTEAERIRALRDQGRIDDVQARRLLNALGVSDVDAELNSEPAGDDAVEAPVTVMTAASAESDQTAATPAADIPEAAAPEPAAPQSAAAKSAADTRPAATEHIAEVRRWARIELFACELDVTIDAGVAVPAVETKNGEVGVETTDDGWRIAQRDRSEGNWLERLIDGVHQGRVTLRLPEGTGVDLDVKAGDVELHGVPALRGRLLAGDLDARGLRAVDLSVSAGDVDLSLDPTAGMHRVRLSVGDLSIRLPAHADVEVEGHVSIGDASASAPFSTRRTGMVAQLVQGTMGQGSATLRADVGTGDLTVRSDGHAR